MTNRDRRRVFDLVDPQCQIHPHRLGVGRGAGAAFAQRRAVVGEDSNDGVTLHPRPRLRHQVGESRQRHELARGEEVTEGS